jgi:hypothetical protein
LIISASVLHMICLRDLPSFAVRALFSYLPC